MTKPDEARPAFVPHFAVTTVDGRPVRYDGIWQRRNLVLVLVGTSEPEAAARYASELARSRDEFDRGTAAVVVTPDPVGGLPAPVALVADRWGEILHLEAPPGGRISELPNAGELLSWVHFAAIQCPECPP